MSVIVTYDLNSKHTEFKNAMLAKGYEDFIVASNNTICALPNTTLKHNKKDQATVLADAKDTAEKLRITLEKCIAITWQSWTYHG